MTQLDHPAAAACDTQDSAAEPRGAPLTFAGVTLRNLLRHPLRTVLTALGVSVGVIAVVALAAISDGFWAGTETALHIGGTDLMVFQAKQSADILSSLDEERTLADLRSMDIVQQVAGVLWWVLPVNKHPLFFVLGVRREEYPFEKLAITDGRRSNSPDEIILGRIAARSLEAGVGDHVTIGGRQCRVSGIFESGIVVLDGGAIVDMDVLQELADKKGKVTSIQVKLREGVPKERGVREIESRLPHLVAVSSASEYVKVDRGLLIMKAMVWAVSLIALIIGGVVVLNTMWMAVFERTREIGILRALGWSRGTVLQMIIIESAFIGLLSAAIGSVLGVGLAEMATRLRFTEQFISPVYGPWIFLQAAALSLVIGVLGGLIPSWRASTFSPVEALRYE